MTRGSCCSGREGSATPWRFSPAGPDPNRQGSNSCRTSPRRCTATWPCEAKMAERETGPDLSATHDAKLDAQHLPPALRERLAAVRLLAMDVDGVLTDGTILWTARPQRGAVLESKAFSVKDGLGLSLARIAGL